MTLEEAIKHAEEVAKKNEHDAEVRTRTESLGTEHCLECAEEHRQLAEWLKELEWRRSDMETPPNNEWEGYSSRLWKNAYARGYNDAKREIALSGEYERAYRRGWHDAIGKALDEAYNIHCEEGYFKVVQYETLLGVGMSQPEE